MSDRFNADEIFEIAIKIEKNGQAFYSRAAEIFADNAELKKLMTDLVVWESSHEKLFKEMKAEFAANHPGSVAVDPELQSAKYLQAIADGKIFKLATVEEEAAKVSDNIEEVLDYAISKEKEAVVFFLSLQDLVPEQEGKQRIQDVINEELGHAIYLAEKKEALTK